MFWRMFKKVFPQELNSQLEVFQFLRLTVFIAIYPQKQKIIASSLVINWLVFGENYQVGGVIRAQHSIRLTLLANSFRSESLSIGLVLSSRRLVRLGFGLFGIGEIDFFLCPVRKELKSNMKTFFH